jgi:serine/threonine protein phosphatase PrpC
MSDWSSSFVQTGYNGRYQPYNGKHQKKNNGDKKKPVALTLRSGDHSDKHPVKESENADRYFHSACAIAVCDGVGGCAEVGVPPSALAVHMAQKIEEELSKRLAVNALMYDSDKKMVISSDVHPKHGGWLRNLCVAAFYDTKVLGSTVLGVTYLATDKLCYLTLGDISVLVFRQCSTGGVREVFQNKVVRIPNPNGGPSIPPQAGIFDIAQMSSEFAQNVFKDADYGVFYDLCAGDTIVICSDGVSDNVFPGQIRELVSKAYDNKKSPTDLAKELVAAGIAGNHKPDDTTCAVGYVYLE